MEIYQTDSSQQVIEWTVRGDPAAEEKLLSLLIIS